jgi:hypothetical protein
LSRSINKHGHHRQFLFLIGRFLPTKFRFNWPNGFRGEESKKSANQKQESPADRDEKSNIYGCHRQFLFLIGRFLKILSSETALPNESKLGMKHLDQNEMSTSHRGPSIDASYHVSVHLAKLFQSRRFLEITDNSCF